MRLVIALLLSLLMGPLLAGCDRQKPAEPQGEAATPPPAAGTYATGRLDRSRAGTPAPDTVFENPEGKPARLSDFRGRPLLVNLWATWCGPCVVEMPSLDGLAERESGRVKVLALSQDMAGRETVNRFFAERDLEHLEPYLDSRLAVMTSLRVDTLPTTILYDSKGLEVWRMTGMADWESDRAARLLTEADRPAG